MKKKRILSMLVLLMAAVSGANAQIAVSGEGNTFTFTMPAYNVEVSTELWYKVNEEKTLDENIAAYGTKSDFFLNRTLTANVWNTFASPFAIAAGDMTKYFGAGAKVRQLSSTSVDGTVLTLNFTDATEIVAGQPYLVKPAANVDFSADGKEFAGVDLTAASATPTATTYVNFVPTLGKTAVTGDVKDILILNTSGTLVHPSATGDMKGFRGYFVMHDAASWRPCLRHQLRRGRDHRHPAHPHGERHHPSRGHLRPQRPPHPGPAHTKGRLYPERQKGNY